MPDNTGADSPKVETGTTTEAGVSTETVAAAKPITMAEVEATIKKFLAPLSNIVHAKNRIATKTETHQGNSESEPTPDAILQSRIAAVEASQRQNFEEKLDLHIEKLATAEGIDDEKRLKIFKKMFKSEFKDKLTSTPEGFVFREFDGDTPKPLKDLMTDYLRGEGESFRPAVSTPGNRGVRSASNGSPARSSGSDRSVYEMTAAERADLIDVNKDGTINMAKLRSRIAADK